MDFFRPFLSQHEALCGSLVLLKLDIGEVIYTLGSEVGGMYTIAQGEVRLKNEQGNEHLHRNGETFGESELLLNIISRLESAEAVSPTYLLQVDKQVYDRFLRQEQIKRMNVLCDALLKTPDFRNINRDAFQSLFYSARRLLRPRGSVILSLHQPNRHVIIASKGTLV
jgi:hypothetical protein